MTKLRMNNSILKSTLHDENELICPYFIMETAVTLEHFICECPLKRHNRDRLYKTMKQFFIIIFNLEIDEMYHISHSETLITEISQCIKRIYSSNH